MSQASERGLANRLLEPGCGGNEDSMQRKIMLTCAAIALIAAAVPVRAASVQKLQNDKVRVLEDTLAPGASESIADGRPSVIVYEEGTAAELAFANGPKHKQSVRRGETVPEPAGLRTITNAGSTPLRLVRTEFLTDGSEDKWGMTGLPPNYKLLFENRYSRTYDIRIAAHQKEQKHTHRARIVIALSGAKLEHMMADGSVQPSTLKTGEIAWRPGQTHVGHNMGDTNLWVIAIEPK